MSRTLRNRLLMVLPTFVGVTLLVFLITALAPADPLPTMPGADATAGHQQPPRAEPGLEQPWPVRYLVWLGQAAGGDLGRSVSLARPVAETVLAALGPTLLLVGTALILASLSGLAAGLAAARQRRRSGRWTFGLLVLLGVSTPSFVVGLLFVLVFAVWPGWLPISGLSSAFGSGGAAERLSHLVLPVLSLALVAGAVIAREARAAALDVRRSEPIRLARLNGIGERRIARGPVLRAVLSRVVPLIGLQAGFLIGGAVYVETIFEWPGLGRLLAEAVVARDLPLVQGGILVLAVVYLLVTLAADLAGLWLDPRTRVG